MKTAYGYAAGGGRPGQGSNINVIDKYAFGSNANGTDVGDLVAGRNSGMSNGASSTTHGYQVGGRNSGGYFNILEKWSFTVDTNATDVGDLTSTRNAQGTIQV